MLTRQVSLSIEQQEGYCVVAFMEEISKLGEGDINAATGKLIKELTQLKTPACLVDLTALQYMGSSLVACVVRIWKSVKAQHGTMVVVVSSEGIYDVLKVTGLTKIWTIVDTLEAGIHILGYSPKAKVAKRERRLLFFVGPLALLCSSVAVAFWLIPQLSSIAQPADSVLYSIIGLSVVSSAISSFREQTWRRIVSIAVLFLGLGLIGTLVALRKPPTSDNASSTVPSVRSSTSTSDSKGPKDDAIENPNPDDVEIKEGEPNSTGSDAGAVDSLANPARNADITRE